MRTIRSSWGFSLIELMVVIVIIGILAAIAMPAYRKYIVDSKIAEAYSSMDAMIKNELAFFGEHNEFHQFDRNPDLITNSMRIEAKASWDQFGYPIAVNTNVFFSYGAYAGKIDTAGTELAASTAVAGAFFDTLSTVGAMSGVNTDGTACNESSSTPADLGVVAQNGLDWVIVRANSHLDGILDGAECTGIFRVIQTDPANALGPYSGGFVVVNRGL